MKLVLKEKKLVEQDGDELKTHKFSEKELENRTQKLDNFMHNIAIPLQEKVPLQVASEYFLKYIKGQKVSSSDEKDSLNIANFADEQGLVRIADIFILGEIYNNIDLSWMLDKYNKG